MKKLLVILAAAALIIGPTVSFARTPGKGGGRVVKKMIWCCFPDGGCVQTSKENCEFKKARVVKSCDECESAKKK